MSNTPDLATCLAADDPRGGQQLLPVNPFMALHYHFGMLLGVDDFETEQAYHRAKMRLHNAWLHREGVVWGFGVRLDTERVEIRVTPGLALDAAGHELHLESDACLNLGEWFDKHQEDPDFQIETIGEQKRFNAHVLIRFKACLTRQVPALMEPCNNADTATAYSRVFETLEILLLPNLAAARPLPFHRLRLMFGLDEPKQQEGSTENRPEDQAVLNEVEQVRALPSAEQPAAWLALFHRLAALDEIEMKPAMSEDGARLLFFPGQEDEPVLLANISDLTLSKQNGSWVLSGGTVDTGVRPTHVATTTIQDLLCGLLVEKAATGAERLSPSGPRVDPDSVTMSDNEIVLQLDQPLGAASVVPAAFSVSVFDATRGWRIHPITASIDDALTTVTLRPKTSVFRKGLTRIIARGTGATPLLGANQLPLAGATADAPAPQGTDFVLMKERN
jgi:hypothetical protein